MAEIFSEIVKFFMALVFGVLNFGAGPLNDEINLVHGRLRRSTLDETASSCPANYYCLPQSTCQQPEFFNPIARSIISSTSCKPDFKSSEPYVCCPRKPEQSPMAALKAVKGMSDKVLNFMLESKKNVDQQSKATSQPSSASVERYDGYFDEILSTLENMKS